MSPNSGLDRQAFEAFLANAFAVQQSGLDPQALSAVMEVQRFITISKFKVDEALSLIVDSLLRVSNASGVAIARLEGHQLVYSSVSGSAGTEIGRRLPAVLSACAQGEGKAEILRVENAQTDGRIQAEICRQFGATSLLILPIYAKHAVVGVLQVHFSEAHSFLEREVRAYRLMAGFAGDAISGTEPEIPEQAAVVPRPSDVLTRSLSRGPVLNDNRNDSAQVARVPSFLTQVLDWDGLASFTTAAKQWVQEVRRFCSGNVWPTETIGVTVLLVIALGFAHYYHPPSSIVGSTPSTSNDIPVTFPSPVPANDRKRPDRGTNDGMSPNAAFRRVRIGPNEVDYVAEDVTVKYFTISHPRLQGRSRVRQVNIGDDVTVRYFANDSTFSSQTESVSTSTPTTTPSLPRSQ
jgi:hypothetical protein